MNRRIFPAIIVLIAVCIFSCQQPAAKPAATAEHVFVVNLLPDSLKLKQYLDYHENIWPEVEAGFKKAGYKKIVLYRFEYLLVMTITVPEGSNLDEMGKLAESYDKRCAEWNKLMGAYQTGVAGTKSGQTWVAVSPFYSFSNP